MWDISSPWWETIFRAAIIYAGLFMLFRFFGKKQQGQMSPFDLVLILIISESVSNGLSGGDDSLPTALICASTLMFLSYVVDFGAFKSRKIERLLDGEPQLIISEGKINKMVQNKAHITDDEINEILRHKNIEDIKQVKFAFLETNGKISVIKKDSYA